MQRHRPQQSAMERRAVLAKLANGPPGCVRILREGSQVVSLDSGLKAQDQSEGEPAARSVHSGTVHAIVFVEEVF